jgi:hypothetical protein
MYDDEKVNRHTVSQTGCGEPQNRLRQLVSRRLIFGKIKPARNVFNRSAVTRNAA